MTWRKLNPEDPKTYPAAGTEVDFVAYGNTRCRGFRRADDRWYDEIAAGSVFQPHEVTHWQPLPALPGEEAEAKAEHPAELVERVAKALRACLPVLSSRVDGFYAVSETDCEAMARSVVGAIEAIRPAEAPACPDDLRAQLRGRPR